jgi:hypothetical protein
MTHKELLAKINEPDHWFKPFLDIRQALLAVVDLHGDDYGMCMTCEMKNYPCLTIQAIEKKLK